MRPADIPKTAIITPFGLFEFLCLPFGLRNAAQTFQRMMDRIFGNLPFCFVYMDDILVFSNSLESHQLHLRCVLDLCCLQGLTINLEKFVFAAPQVVYFGHLVSSSGSAPTIKSAHVMQHLNFSFHSYSNLSKLQMYAYIIENIRVQKVCSRI